MSTRKMIGWCLILFGVINVLHAVNLNMTGRGTGAPYAFITALLFTLGAAFLWLSKHGQRRAHQETNKQS